MLRPYPNPPRFAYLAPKDLRDGRLLGIDVERRGAELDDGHRAQTNQPRVE
jgi:hypothetical protein